MKILDKIIFILFITINIQPSFLLSMEHTAPPFYPTPICYVPILVTPVIVNLHEEATHGNLAIISLAAQQGANLDLQRPADGWTLAHIAAATNNIELAALLLLFGADFFISDIKGNNPLHIAFLYGNIEVAHYLVRSQLEHFRDDDFNSIFLDFFSSNCASEERVAQTPLDAAYSLRNQFRRIYRALLYKQDEKLSAKIFFTPKHGTTFQRHDRHNPLKKVDIGTGNFTWTVTYEGQEFGILCPYKTKQSWQNETNPRTKYGAYVAPLQLIETIDFINLLMTKIKALKESFGGEMPEAETVEGHLEEDAAADAEVEALTEDTIDQ